MMKSPSPRPLSIKVIAILYGFFGILGLCYVVFTWFISRPLPPTTVILAAILELALALGVWQLSHFARWIAIGWQGWELIRLVLSMAYPTYWATLRAYLEPTSREMMLLSVVTLSIIFIRKVVWSTMVIWFLITRKAAFGKRVTADQ